MHAYIQTKGKETVVNRAIARATAVLLAAGGLIDLIYLSMALDLQASYGPMALGSLVQSWDFGAWGSSLGFEVWAWAWDLMDLPHRFF